MPASSRTWRAATTHRVNIKDSTAKRISTTTPQRTRIAVPAGATLKRRRTSDRGDKIEWEYGAPTICVRCAQKHLRTPGRYRTLTRWEHEERLERMDERLAREPAVLARRKALVEHPLGTIKTRILSGGFLVRGLEKVGAEVSLAHWAYNFKRVVNLVGVPALLAALS